jgi:hypothetical protein
MVRVTGREALQRLSATAGMAFRRIRCVCVPASDSGPDRAGPAANADCSRSGRFVPIASRRAVWMAHGSASRSRPVASRRRQPTVRVPTTSSWVGSRAATALGASCSTSQTNGRRSCCPNGIPLARSHCSRDYCRTRLVARERGWSSLPIYLPLIPASSTFQTLRVALIRVRRYVPVRVGLSSGERAQRSFQLDGTP